MAEDTAPLAIVVGAGPGLGAAVARGLGRDGYAVALVDPDPDWLEELGGSMQSDGVTTGWTPVEAGDRTGLAAAVERFAEFSGGIDLVVILAADCVAPVVAAARPLLRDGATLVVAGPDALRGVPADGVREVVLSLQQDADVALAADRVLRASRGEEPQIRLQTNAATTTTTSSAAP